MFGIRLSGRGREAARRFLKEASSDSASCRPLKAPGRCANLDIRRSRGRAPPGNSGGQRRPPALRLLHRGYVAGKDKACFEFLVSLDGHPHAEDYGCQLYQAKRVSLRKILTMMTGSSSGIFELVEVWTQQEYDNRN